MSIESVARNEAQRLASTAIEALVSAGEREAARRRVEACIEEVAMRRVLATLPRWRWLKRAIVRARLRNAAAYCEAMRKDDPLARAVCAAMSNPYAKGRA